mgnify:CR=1 FL=1
MAQITFRMAQPEDTALILHFIKGLAVYEKMEDQVVATEELLTEWLFEKQKAEVVIGEAEGKPVGFALFFHNFSTFLGRAGIYSGRPVCRAERAGQGLRQGAFDPSGTDRGRARLRQIGVVVPRLESAVD